MRKVKFSNIIDIKYFNKTDPVLYINKSEKKKVSYKKYLIKKVSYKKYLWLIFFLIIFFLLLYKLL